VSPASEPERQSNGHRPDDLPAELEEVDGVPVPAGVLGRGLSRRPAGALVAAGLPAARAAAVAATGFLAGAAAAGLLHRRRQRQLALRRGRAADGPLAELVQVVGSRSLLVDVHLLGRRDR